MKVKRPPRPPPKKRGTQVLTQRKIFERKANGVLADCGDVDTATIWGHSSHAAGNSGGEAIDI